MTPASQGHTSHACSPVHWAISCKHEIAPLRVEESEAYLRLHVTQASSLTTSRPLLADVLAFTPVGIPGFAYIV